MSEVENVEVEEVDENAEIRDAFDEAISNEKEEDDVKMQMIGAGATFKNVTRLYNQFMIDAGMAISKADRNQIVDDTLADMDLDTEEAFDAAVKALVEAITGSTDRSAASLIRAFGKKNDIQVYTKPKSEGGSRNQFVHRFYDALVANPGMTEQEAHDFIHGKNGNPETSDNVKNYEKMHQNVRILANTINDKINA